VWPHSPTSTSTARRAATTSRPRAPAYSAPRATRSTSGREPSPLAGRGQVDSAEPLRTREREPQSRARRIHRHVPHHGARRGDRQRFRALAGRIERHDLVLPRLVVPDAPVRADRDAVRLAVAAAGAREFTHLSGRWTEPAQLAARVV